MIHRKYIHPEQFRFSFTKVQQTSLNFLHKKQIIQEPNNLLIILKCQHFILYSSMKVHQTYYITNKLFKKQIINLLLLMQIIYLVLIFNVSYLLFFGSLAQLRLIVVLNNLVVIVVGAVSPPPEHYLAIG